jgi:4-aminobutyrate aminotransferase-like enzyme
LGALLSVKGPWPISADPAEATWWVAEAWKRGVIRATASALPNVIKIKPRLVIDEGEVEPSWASSPTA